MRTLTSSTPSKAFLNKEAARIVDAEGLCLDVSGGGELACALAAGFPAERIFMHGNNKTPQELREAIGAAWAASSSTAASSWAASPMIAGELGVEQAIYMRITPGVEADTHSTSARAVRTRSSVSPCVTTSRTAACKMCWPRRTCAWRACTATSAR